ncbi:MAG: SDR family NAD(P)-dependent oxidoreductase [Bacteroidales bacterium]|nr:SDR family NAD(P)-dependent oxidoreductase [Bacteroidales bacterium]MCB9013962.1 SDR family NAD(P)-dependent oxidoreductase [Bacteroidales bacterium]
MKKLIIIGATSGIGKELAKIYALATCQVGITGRRYNLLEELKSQYPNNIISKGFDIRNTSSLTSHLEELVSELGGLDLLILCAGTGDLNPELDFSIEQNTIETNVQGFTCIADWAFNFFKNQKYGHFVAISSIAGLRGSRHAPSYNASKAYQIAYLEALRQKSHKLKLPVYISDIRPGLVDTDLAKGEGLFWIAKAENVAMDIYKAINSHKPILYVTRRWILIALFLKLIPPALFKRF